MRWYDIIIFFLILILLLLMCYGPLCFGMLKNSKNSGKYLKKKRGAGVGVANETIHNIITY